MAKTRTEWESIVGEFGRSGMTQAEFAKSSGVALATLQYWIRKLRDDARPARVELRPAAAAPDVASDVSIVEAYTDQFSVHFKGPASPEYIAAVLRALARPC